MGKMKEIYEMVQDGSSDIFIDAYKNAVISKALGFTYNYKFYDMIKAKSIVALIEKAQTDYNAHIDHEAEVYAEWQAEIRRGK